MKGDLHCHSYYSDGSASVDQVVHFAIAEGLDFISLTDHDTMAGVERAVNLGKRLGIRVIPGLEISAADEETGRNVHLICYMPKRLDNLEKFVQKTLDSRNEAARPLVEEIGKVFPITWKDVVEAAGPAKCIFRQHIMRALMERGYSFEIFGDFYQEVFSRIPYSVRFPEVREAVEVIRAAGGVAALAHPGAYGSLGLAEELARDGKIQAIELSHPRNTDEDKKEIARIAMEYGLVPIGGSDYHGFYTSHPHPLGTCTTPGESLDALLKIREQLNK